MKKILSFTLLFVFLQAILSAINPSTEYKFTPKDIKLDFDEYKIGTADGECLNLWHLKSRAKIKRNVCVLIVGSDSGNMGYNLPYVSSLLSDGFDVVTFDYRGFGSSSSFKHNSKRLFHKEYIEDFTSAISWIKRDLKPNKIACLAFSMGSLICNYGKEKEPFDYLISEGFISSPKLITDRIKEQKSKSVLLPLMNSNYESLLQKYKIPILIFASAEDKITTLEDAKIFSSSSSNRKIIAYKGGHLAGARSIGVKEYGGLITDFLLNS